MQHQEIDRLFREATSLNTSEEDAHKLAAKAHRLVASWTEGLVGEDAAADWNTCSLSACEITEFLSEHDPEEVDDDNPPWEDLLTEEAYETAGEVFAASCGDDPERFRELLQEAKAKHEEIAQKHEERGA